MFSKGDKVIYGQMCVCIVEDITEKELIKNDKQMYYVLRPVFHANNTIYAPVNNSKTKMRFVMNYDEANALIDKIPENSDDIKEYSNEDFESICFTSCDELVGILAAIYTKKINAAKVKKKLCFQEDKLKTAAENLLFGELSVALNIELSGVQKYIKERLSK